MHQRVAAVRWEKCTHSRARAQAGGGGAAAAVAVVAPHTALAPRDMRFAQLKLATNNFSTRVGEGATGEVFSGELDGAPVAVKCLKVPPHLPAGAREEVGRRFRAELSVLGECTHARIVRLLGFAVDEDPTARFPFALVFEYLGGGSLAEWLRGPRDEPAMRHHPDGSELSALQRVDAVLGTGAGLAYLHGRREHGDGGPDVPVVHRDVKSANIGLAVHGGALYAKLFDCGLAKAMRVDAATAAGAGGASFTGGFAAGTAGYMAPEVRNGTYTVRSEVYSFGVVLLEVLTGRRVAPTTASDVLEVVEEADERGEDGVALLVAQADPRCGWPHGAKRLLAALLVDCIRLRERERPSAMGEVLDRLRGVRAIVDAAGAVPLRSCVVCIDGVAASSGVACTGGHFVCVGCLPGTVEFSLDPRKLAANAGCVMCPGQSCGQKWAVEDLEEHLDKKTLIAYARAVRYQAFDAVKARRDAEAALAAREVAARDARVALCERARQRRAIIAERDLLLRCPRCAFPFDDYDGCNALTCGKCGCGFCALCLVDCGTDAHAHYGTSHRGDIFNKALFDETHRQRRSGLIIAAVRGMARDGLELQRAVLGALSVDMNGLHIDERAVAAAVFDGVGAAGGATNQVGAHAGGARGGIVAWVAGWFGGGVRECDRGCGHGDGGAADAIAAVVRDLRGADPGVQLAAAQLLSGIARDDGA